MEKLRNRKASKVTAVLLALMIAVVFMPTFAFAAEKGKAKDIMVFMTVSYEGNLALTKNDETMAWKRVMVSDADKDGKITVDEAMVAAHDMWFEGGAAAGYAAPDGWVTKLWGKETSNTLFFVNGNGINGVAVDTVKDGDLLLASVNQDAAYTDYYTEFDKTVVETEPNTEVTLTLTGRLGMGTSTENKPLKDITIGTWESKDQPFVPIQKDGQDLKTNENGEATVSFDKPGFYMVTDKGTVSGTDWNDNPAQCSTIATVCLFEVKGPNTMTIGKTKTVKAKAKKTTKISAKKAFSVKNAIGKVTYKKKSGNKKITVAKNGTVTVKKGLKKGKTYTVKAYVTAEGDDDYFPATEVATVKIKIK